MDTGQVWRGMAFKFANVDFPPEQETEGDDEHGEDLAGLQVFVQLWPEVVVDGRDDEVNLENLGCQAHHQEEGEEGDEEHLREKK